MLETSGLPRRRDGDHGFVHLLKSHEFVTSQPGVSHFHLNLNLSINMLIVTIHLILVAHLVCIGLFAHLANAHSWFADYRGVGGVLVGRRVGRGQGGQGA